MVVDNTLSFSFDAPGKDKSRSRSTEGHTETSPSASSTSGSSKEKSNRKRSLDDVDYSSSETDTDSTVSVGEDRTVRGGQKSSAEKVRTDRASIQCPRIMSLSWFQRGTMPPWQNHFPMTAELRTTRRKTRKIVQIRRRKLQPRSLVRPPTRWVVSKRTRQLCRIGLVWV